MTLNTFNLREYLRKKHIIVLTNTPLEGIHLFLKKEFRTYDVFFDDEKKFMSSIVSIDSFSKHVYAYMGSPKAHHQKIDLVVLVLTYDFTDLYGNTVHTLAISVGRNNVFILEIHVIENSTLETIRVKTIKVLRSLYQEVKNPSAF